MVEGEIIFQVERLNVKVGQRYLLKDIDWCVRRGEQWVVYGANGSGKTTLLSVLAGFHHYTEGEVKVFGKAYQRDNILALRRKIGWVSGSFFDKCYARESVLDIVLSGLSGTLGLCGSIDSRHIIRAKQLLQALGILGKVNAGFETLSKGERQRVLIARALLADPEVIIWDEPAAGLDVLAREYLLSTIRALALDTNKTMIYVTHYTEEILDVFSHCLLLKDGRSYGQDRIEKYLNAQALTEFWGYPVEIIAVAGRHYLTMAAQTQIPHLLQAHERGRC